MSQAAASSSSDDDVHHVDADSLPDWMLPERTRILASNITIDNKKKKQSGSSSVVVYWMQRDVRAVDNWALLYAAHVANEANVPLHVFYVLPPPPPSTTNSGAEEDPLPPSVLQDLHMTERHGSFLLGGLELVHAALQETHVPLHMILPPSRDKVGQAVLNHLEMLQPHLVICDMTPLKPFRPWLEEQTVPLLRAKGIPLHQVDAHNVVPVWHASPKQEVGARTLRPKIHKVVSKFLQDYPEFAGNAHLSPDERKKVKLAKFDKDAYVEFLQLDESVPPVTWAQPGTECAKKQFQHFLSVGLKRFDTHRNDPTLTDVCSNLSPWLNHGHISFLTLARHVKSLNKHANGTAAYIEEGLVRRELSDNFCYYQPEHYDGLEAAAGWARESLELHASDPREYTFSLEELTDAQTHDDLWNAAQLQLVQEGKMHGFLRMYWAKKILEWTESPLVALRTAQYLNDRYALDGNDPNGFVGVGWSIMGIHDQGWKEREIFGKIRYMNYAGCKRKFKVEEFVQRYPGAAANADAAAKKHGVDREDGKKKSANSSKTTTTGKKGTKRKAPAK